MISGIQKIKLSGAEKRAFSKEFAKKCNDFGELFDYLGREGVELPDELVDPVTGGMSQVVPVGNGSKPSIYF